MSLLHSRNWIGVLVHDYCGLVVSEGFIVDTEHTVEFFLVENKSFEADTENLVVGTESFRVDTEYVVGV